ncbi:type IX secretion system sortase PorU [Hymenobacter sp. BT730]|uniref:type IX secretion system sortase PorU n=1 Tax=Hymenobacter sp. BT730 TaxID=3063332 RepID=UPI0026DF36E6|nr:type IX secretion system sortase PorU [Hymenobacter sp. BT730]
MPRRPLLLLLWMLLGWSWAGQAQTPDDHALRVALHWQGTETVYLPQGRTRQVPTFAEAGFRPGQLLPFYQFSVDGRVATDELQDAVYEPLTAAEIKALGTAPIAGTSELRRASGMENRQARTLLTLTPLRRNAGTGQVEKLISFTYSYTIQPATQALRRGGAHVYAANSVLSQGQWYKIGVPASGIYKLDKATLRTLGLDVQTLDPRRLQLYGNATGQLPQLNSAPRPDDLVENAIYVSGNNDATFNDEEYVLFYARGPHTWEPNPSSPRTFRHLYHTYTDTAYYFLTVGVVPGRRVAPAATITGTPTATVTAFPDHQFHEIDLVNLLKSGRQWLGEGFDAGTTQKDFSFSFPDLVANEPVSVTSLTVATANTTTSFQVALNGQPIGSQSIARLSGDYFPEAANLQLSTFTSSAPSTTELKVSLTYNAGGDFSAKGYLDYLEITAWRKLRLSGSALEFRALANATAGTIQEFVLENGASATVWDVTNPRRAQERPLTNGTFLAPADSLREFVAFTGSSFPLPRLFGRVANQNLHALSQGNQLDAVIVTHPIFRAEAERLAAHRLRHDGLQMQVVTTEQVYNEFSSGGQDITAIRDFMKMVYEANQRPAGSARMALLLFGDASYDYKADPGNDPKFLPEYWSQRQITDKNNQNYVPVYESYESFARIFPRAFNDGISFSSDDYFGLLDDNEGEWKESYEADIELLDIGIGRLPVRTPNGEPHSTAQARLVVDKLIAYDQPTSFGKWRNRITFVSDDGDSNLHLRGAELLANQIMKQEPAYNVHKVYLDMYPQVVVAGGQRSPEAARAIDQSLEEGSLLINYTGHGGPKAWSDEQIFTIESIKKLQNTQRLAFLLTATCDFSTYDDPGFDSAGEVALTDVAGGAIGLLTTTRVVLSGNNSLLNQQFFNAVFKEENGRLPSLGEVMIRTKNQSVSGAYNRNFALLGDPSMRLAYPNYTTTLRELNHHAITTTPTDTLKAMSTVALAGDVTDRSGALASSFSGTVQVTVLDKPAPVVTLGNEPNDGQQTVQVQESVLYDGKATVRDGRFQLEFMVPRDINYNIGPGKISLYAAAPQLGLDAHGANKDVLVGSVASDIKTDTIPPVVQLFLDSESFVFGGLTGSESMLLAQLSDSSGINTAGAGIGHEITAVLDNDPSKLLVLNSYYTADVDNFRSGRVRYLLKDLAPGPHVLRLKAWDTFNNSTEQELEFIVVRNEKLALEHILNYPNPFATTTTFHFDHNRHGEDLDVQVQIFTVTGKLIRTLATSIPTSPAHVGTLSWDGRDEFNDQVARGVYLYRLHVRSPRDGAQVSKFEKLVLLR